MNALCGNFARLGVVAKFSASQTRSMARVTPSGRLILTKTTGHSRNTHRSNRAKEGLYLRYLQLNDTPPPLICIMHHEMFQVDNRFH